MDMLGDKPTLSLKDEKWRIYSRHEASSPQFIGADAVVQNSSVTEGCEIFGTVRNSVLGIGVHVAAGAVVENSVVLSGSVIEEGAVVQYAILDENVTVGKNAVIGSADAGSANIAVVGAQIRIADNSVVEAGAMVSEQKA